MPALQLAAQPSDLHPLRGISLSFVSEKAPCQYLEVSRMCAQLGLILGPCSWTPHPLLPFQDGWVQIISSSLLGFGCGLGRAFHSHCRGYSLTSVIVHSPFIATKGRFFHFSICSHQNQIMLWEAVGGRICPRRSPLFAGRGHYCLTFLLAFSIPAAPSSADCQLCLPSRPSLPSVLLLPAFPLPGRAPEVRRTFNTKFKAGVTLVKHWWASWPDTKPQSPVRSDLNSPPVLGTCAFTITRLHSVKERLFPLFHK